LVDELEEVFKVDAFPIFTESREAVHFVYEQLGGRTKSLRVYRGQDALSPKTLVKSLLVRGQPSLIKPPGEAFTLDYVGASEGGGTEPDDRRLVLFRLSWPWGLGIEPAEQIGVALCDSVVALVHYDHCRGRQPSQPLSFHPAVEGQDGGDDNDGSALPWRVGVRITAPESEDAEGGGRRAPVDPHLAKGLDGLLTEFVGLCDPEDGARIAVGPEYQVNGGLDDDPCLAAAGRKADYGAAAAPPFGD
jgi:hypothetical protein